MPGYKGARSRDSAFLSEGQIQAEQRGGEQDTAGGGSEKPDSLTLGEDVYGGSGNHRNQNHRQTGSGPSRGVESQDDGSKKGHRDQGVENGEGGDD